MMLNLTKCTFRVSAGMFLGHIVTQSGIEANPPQVRALIEMSSLRCKKDIQGLNGIVAALSIFISRSSDKCQGFFF